MKIPHSHCGFTSTDLIALLASALMLLLITSEWLFSQSPNHPGLDNLANRTACSANLRSIAQSMTIYAQSDQATFPCTPGPSGDTYSNAPQNPMGYT
ncbi:MAG TPA: hypothetical protein VKJ65_04770 [Phycisphaerae bacterium]|nr:hypothetical protein [Phycisphaerae bacterium]